MITRSGGCPGIRRCRPPRAAAPRQSPPEGESGMDEPSRALVGVRSTVPDDALTAGVLGTERSGSGVCIRADGLLLTVGYLVAEAEQIWLSDRDGRLAPGDLLAHDPESGLALVRPLTPLALAPLALGRGAALEPGSEVTVAGFDEQPAAARVVARQEFAGYWEYLIEEALFTAPAYPSWGGAALLDAAGRLCAIGSLLVQVESGEEPGAANMMVPVETLTPVLDELVTRGRRVAPARPWLGMFVQPDEGRLEVVALYEGCPAARAGLRPGDILTAVGGRPVASLGELFRGIWALGPAGVEVPLEVVRDGTPIGTLHVESADRLACQRSPRLH